MCLYWAITGPRFLSPARHLLAVALTRQSPAANAMWQCWDYNIWPVLPGINAITAPRPLRWATPPLGERKRSGNWEKALWKRREQDDDVIDEWMWENGWGRLAPVTVAQRRYKHLTIKRRCFCLILWHFWRMRSRRNCGLLWSCLWQVNHLLNNDDEICHPHHQRTTMCVCMSLWQRRSCCMI